MGLRERVGSAEGWYPNCCGGNLDWECWSFDRGPRKASKSWTPTLQANRLVLEKRARKSGDHASDLFRHSRKKF